jgi:hypothetical protein
VFYGYRTFSHRERAHKIQTLSGNKEIAMNGNGQETQHPSAPVLALFSHRDLPWKTMWRLKRHINRCEDCEQQVAEYRAARAELRREAQSETLTAFEAIADWSVLEREMLGNIAVGVSAARCVDHVHRSRSWLIKGSLAAALTTLFVAGWITHIPSEQTQHLAASLRQIIGLDRPVYTARS